jgi:hypothetical protein
MLWIFIIAGLFGVRVNDFTRAKSVISSYLRIFSYSQNLRTAGYFCLPVLIFIMLYSYLPHKELRFIFIALPIFTMFAAVSLSELLPNQSKRMIFPLCLLSDRSVNQFDQEEDVKLRKKNDDLADVSNPSSGISGVRSLYYRLIRYTLLLLSDLTHVVCFFLSLSFAVLMILALMGYLTNIFTQASYHNYPGAVALDRLVNQHIGLQLSLVASKKELITRPIFVHLDVLTVTTGVTR